MRKGSTENKAMNEPESLYRRQNLGKELCSFGVRVNPIINTMKNSNWDYSSIKMTELIIRVLDHCKLRKKPLALKNFKTKNSPGFSQK